MIRTVQKSQNKWLFIALALGAVSVVSTGISVLSIKKNAKEVAELRELIATPKPISEIEISDTALTEFVMNNPETIIKSLTKFRFEQEQLAKAQESEQMKSFADKLYGDANDPFFGNPNGKHVIIEFADYNCGYCKRLAPTLDEFVKINPEAKVIIKEYPIFQNQPSSAYSAIMGTAVFLIQPELYEEFHHKVISQKKITIASVDAVLREIGLSKEQLQPVLETAKNQVEKNRTLGAQLNVSGTPTLIINGQKVGGNLSAQALMGYFN